MPTAATPTVSRLRIPVLILFILVSLLLIVSARPRAGEPNDFTVYFRAARELAADRSPYDLDIAGAERLHYVYPPVLAAFLVPLAGLPEAAATLVWFIAGAGSYFGCLVLMRRFLAFHPDPLPVIAASFLAVAPFVRGGLRSGQVAGWLLLLILLALLSGEAARRLRAGGALGAAIAVKLYPAAALIGWLVARKWKLVFAALAFAVVISILAPTLVAGPRDGLVETGRYWSDLVPRALGWQDAPDWYGYRSRHSQSIPSALYRWTSVDAAGSFPGGGRAVHVVDLGTASRWILILVGVGIFVALAVVGLHRLETAPIDPFPAKPLLQAGLIAGLLPILGPVSLKAAFTALLPAWAAFLAVPCGPRRVAATTRALALAGLFLHLYPFRLIHGTAVAHWLEARSDVLVGALLIYLALWIKVWWITASRWEEVFGPSP